MISSLYSVFNPILAVRYNSYDKTVICYTEGQYEAPEGCGTSIHPSILQTLSAYTVLITSLSLTAIGFTYVSRPKKK